MKIKDFTIFSGKTRLVISSSSIKLENAQIQGTTDYGHPNPNEPPGEKKVLFIAIKMSGIITDKDSLIELKGLINQTDF